MDESETEAAERRSLRCVWVAGGRALTEQEAAAAIVSEARLLLQEDLAQLGVQWDPVTLDPAAPALHCPDDSSGGSDPSAASYRQPHEEQRDSDTNWQKRDQARAHGETSSSAANGQGELEQEEGEGAGETKTEPRRSEPEDGEEVQNLGKMKDVATAPLIKPMHHPEKLEKDDADKDLIAGDKEPRENTKEETKQEGQQSKETAPVSPESDQVNVPTRSLTQELSEVLASPFSQPKAVAQPSSTPVPPPRFRAPISRAEEPRARRSAASQEDGSSTLVVSPVQAGRLKHSRALIKVLNSIRTDKMLQDDTPAAQTSPSDPAGAAQRDPSQSSSSPEAKRRRVDGGGKDDFSSPELFVENEKGENDEGGAKKVEGESFGDSFELDTQTEKLIVQQTSECRDENRRSADGMVQTEKPTGEEEAAAASVVTADFEKNTNERRNCLSTPNDVNPRFNISLTDSQMELVLKTSQQVSHQK